MLSFYVSQVLRLQALCIGLHLIQLISALLHGLFRQILCQVGFPQLLIQLLGLQHQLGFTSLHFVLNAEPLHLY